MIFTNVDMSMLICLISSYWSLALLHFCTGGHEWRTECQGRHNSRKSIDHQNLSKNDKV